jgi:uncharacterized protein YraI
MFARTATLVSALLLSAAFVGEAQAYPAYATTSLNVRSGPGTGYPVVATLGDGQPVEVIGCAGSWCEVDLGRGSGFASASYLRTAGARQTYRPPVVVVPQPYYVERDYGYYGHRNYNYRDDGRYYRGGGGHRHDRGDRNDRGPRGQQPQVQSAPTFRDLGGSVRNAP